MPKWVDWDANGTTWEKDERLTRMEDMIGQLLFFTFGLDTEWQFVRGCSVF